MSHVITYDWCLGSHVFFSYFHNDMTWPHLAKNDWSLVALPNTPSALLLGQFLTSFSNKTNIHVIFACSGKYMYNLVSLEN